MQREDVEHMRVNLMRVAYDCSEEPGWEHDAPLLRNAASYLAALLDRAERAEAERHRLKAENKRAA